MALRMSPKLAGVAEVLRLITSAAAVPPVMEATPVGVLARLNTSPVR